MTDAQIRKANEWDLKQFAESLGNKRRMSKGDLFIRSFLVNRSHLGQSIGAGKTIVTICRDKRGKLYTFLLSDDGSVAWCAVPIFKSMKGM